MTNCRVKTERYSYRYRIQREINISKAYIIKVIRINYCTQSLKIIRVITMLVKSLKVVVIACTHAISIIIQINK